MDTLIQPDVTVAEVRPSRHALRERATTYAVFGLGLVGITAFIVVGPGAGGRLSYRSPPGTQSTSPRSRLAYRARMNSRSESRLR